MKHQTYIAKTLSGLEETLASELAALGATDIQALSRAVSFRGDKRLLYSANLWLRTATRILTPLRSFNASNPDKLYHQIYSLDWCKRLNPEMTLAVDALVSKSNIDNSMFAALKVKDAIVDHIRSKVGARPSVDSDNPDLRLNLFLKDNQATLSLDSSGEPLSRRGYRTESGPAPLSEALAAGIVALSEWDKTTPFIDPMCGAGTIAIEAALIAANIAPGSLGRKFGFESWLDFDAELFAEIKSEANKRRRAIGDTGAKIFAKDKSAEMLEIAKRNAERAGVSELIEFSQADFFTQASPTCEPGTLVMNPPYDERIELSDSAEFYRNIGDTFKQRYTGYKSFVFSGARQAVKALGLKSSRKIPLFNGPLECRLYRYDIF
jgi:putative N6-adenine-specific DNA methylase